MRKQETLHLWLNISVDLRRMKSVRVQEQKWEAGTEQTRHSVSMRQNETDEAKRSLRHTALQSIPSVLVHWDPEFIVQRSGRYCGKALKATPNTSSAAGAGEWAPSNTRQLDSSKMCHFEAVWDDLHEFLALTKIEPPRYSLLIKNIMWPYLQG